LNPSDQAKAVSKIMGKTFHCKGKTFHFKDKLKANGWTFILKDDPKNRTGYAYWKIDNAQKSDPEVQCMTDIQGVWIEEMD